MRYSKDGSDNARLHNLSSTSGIPINIERVSSRKHTFLLAISTLPTLKTLSRNLCGLHDTCFKEQRHKLRVNHFGEYLHATTTCGLRCLSQCVCL